MSVERKYLWDKAKKYGKWLWEKHEWRQIQKCLEEQQVKETKATKKSKYAKTLTKNVT